MMFSRSKTWAIALLVAVFAAGGATGWAAEVWSRGGPRFGPRPRPPNPDRMADFLARRLELSATQRDSVRALLARHNADMQAIWASVRPRFDSLRAVVHTEINALLTPPQRDRHARLLDELEHQHDRRGRRDTTPDRRGRH
jgi:hypothetical protein